VTTSVEQAYAVCEQITRTRARNFHYGIRLLPPSKRTALCALYALSRRIDDIGDGPLPLPEKAAALTSVRRSLRDIGSSSDPVMDLSGHSYETFTDLVSYCRCVAGSVGRLCLGVFGSRPDPNASPYADALGIALQQTNILRDIREDLLTGRIYLPRQELTGYRVELRVDETGALADPTGALAALIVDTAQRARSWYDRGMRLLPLLDRRSAACTAAMAGIYRQLLERIAADPTLVFDQRLTLSGWRKAAVATRALIGVG
jgi:phytoene synthase